MPDGLRDRRVLERCLAYGRSLSSGIEHGNMIAL
jgi:hypothetical protein